MRSAAGTIRAVAATVLLWGTASGLSDAQTLTRVSTDATDAQVAGASRQPSTSADGRFVAFSSTATTLVAGDGNGSADVFVKDRQTGAVTRVSLRTGGIEATGDSVNPDMSADGRYVTFVSAAALTADDTNVNSCIGTNVPGPSCPDVFLHDRNTGTTTRLSVATDGTQANAASAAPKISGDGRYVVFESAATNLYPNDANQLVDVFIRDRQLVTTTLISVTNTGAQSDRAALSPVISDDGARVIFLSDATNLDTTQDSLPCNAAVVACTRAFVRNVAGGTTARLALSILLRNKPAGPLTEAYRISGVALSGDGQLAVATIHGTVGDGTSTSNAETVATVSFGPTATAASSAYLSWPNPQPPRFSRIAVSGNGRTIAYCYEGYAGPPFVVQITDRLTLLGSVVGAGLPIVLGGGSSGQPDCEGVALTDDGRRMFFASSGGALVSGDTNAAFDVFAYERDADNDGMTSEWESAFGLDGADAADAALDPDGDGATNLQEYAAATHPRGLFKYYLAEGAENAFFNTGISVLTTAPLPPSTYSTPIVGEFLGQNGRRTVTPVLATGDRASGQAFWEIDALVYPDLFTYPDQAFSTVIESQRPLAVERTVSWGGPIGTGYGSHAERAMSGPSTTWHFAEGATHGAFDLFYLLQNVGSVPANATITYLRPAPQTPVVRSYSLLPHSRRTIYVDQEPGLGATDVSARIDADQPIFAERAMYMSTAGQPFAGGTASAGITAPATQWFIAEGATGTFFDLYILIGNPSLANAAVTVTYLLPDGTSIDKVHQVAGQSRLTISVKGEDTRLAATAVSATITSTNATPIVVERAMWWPSPNWYEGTVTAATTQAATRWALAGGYLDHRPETATYLLVANPGATPANVTFDVGINGLAAGAGVSTTLACRVTVAVPAHGRYTAGLRTLCPFAITDAVPARIAGTVESDGPPIVVERATYWSAAGQFWAAGASTLLTPLLP